VENYKGKMLILLTNIVLLSKINIFPL
jgi:hypothetical protein